MLKIFKLNETLNSTYRVHAQPDAGGRERVANRERTAPVVPLGQVRRADLLAQSEVVLAEVVGVEGLQVGDDLTLGEEERRVHKGIFFLGQFLRGRAFIT